jgi:hypothetical protein
MCVKLSPYATFPKLYRTSGDYEFTWPTIRADLSSFFSEASVGVMSVIELWFNSI